MTRTADRRSGRSESMIPSGPLQLRRVEWRPDDPRAAVLLIPGFAEHVDRYAHVAKVLNGHGLSVVAIDLPGHGKSTGRRGDIRSFDEFLAAADALLGSIDHSDQDLPLVVLGHSLGGLIALRWLQTRNVRPEILVLSAPWLATSPTLSRLTLVLKKFMQIVAPGFPVRRPIKPSGLTRDPQMQAARVSDPLVVNRISARLVGEVESAQADALGAGPGVPTLVISPGDDPVTDQDVVRKWCRSFQDQIEVMPVPEARHEPFNDLERKDTIDRMGRWIDEHLP